MKHVNLLWFDGESTAPSSPISAEADTTADFEAGSRESAAQSDGKQSETAGEQFGTDAPQGEKNDYKSFKEQFKQEYQADLQRVIDKRFKNAKKVEAQRDALKAENEQYASLMQALSTHYGTDNVEELTGMITSEPAKRETADNPPEAPEAEQAQEAQLQQQQIVENWQKEAESLKEVYPAFSLEQEIDNEKFAAALQSGMSMRDAYQHAHFDEIISGVIRYTAQDVKNSVLSNRELRAARPAENGTQAGAAALVKSDVSKLTKQEMEEIDKRVLRGEHISF